MQLLNFRIKNFRSINNSGDVEVSRLTALVGRNESGKSNLLLGLSTLNPPGGRQPLLPIKDFPRWRRLDECTDDTEVVHTTWKLTDEESAEIGRTLRQTSKIETVTVSRRYQAPNVGWASTTSNGRNLTRRK